MKGISDRKTESIERCGCLKPREEELKKKKKKKRRAKILRWRGKNGSNIKRNKLRVFYSLVNQWRKIKIE